jgi:hypothetical protein
VTNTLAYYDTELITALNVFKTFSPSRMKKSIFIPSVSLKKGHLRLNRLNFERMKEKNFFFVKISYPRWRFSASPSVRANSIKYFTSAADGMAQLASPV